MQTILYKIANTRHKMVSVVCMSWIITPSNESRPHVQISSLNGFGSRRRIFFFETDLMIHPTLHLSSRFFYHLKLSEPLYTCIFLSCYLRGYAHYLSRIIYITIIHSSPKKNIYTRHALNKLITNVSNNKHKENSDNIHKTHYKHTRTTHKYIKSANIHSCHHTVKCILNSQGASAQGNHYRPV